jgi:preprotein translocase subunit SecG
MMNLLLGILAVIVGFLILFVVLLKRASIGIGVRTTRNIFTDQIANMAVSTWLLVILFLIEIVIILILFSSPKRLSSRAALERHFYLMDTKIRVRTPLGDFYPETMG